MTPKTIQVRSEQPKPSADWFDDDHESVLILQGRDCEENGASPQAEAARCAA